MTLQGLKVGQSKFDLRFWREGKRSRWDVVSRQGDIDVQQRSFEWWSVEPEAKAPKEHRGKKAADGGGPVRKSKDRK